MSLFKFAENILNNLDQTTQSSIQTALNKSTSSQSNENDDKYTKTRPSKSKVGNNLGVSQSASTLLVARNEQKIGTVVKVPSNNMRTSWHAKTSSMSSNNKDDELMQFLNDDSDLNSMTDPLARSSKSSLIKTDTSDIEDNVKFIVGEKSSKHSENEEESFIEKVVSGDIEKIQESDVETNNESLVANYDDDKNLLKNEVFSLNEEIKSYNKRLKNIQDEYQRSKKKIEHYQSQISESDKIIRELRAREEDALESIRNKDAQLAILRVRFDEVDSELKTKRAELEIKTQESERILKDHSNSSDLQSQVVDRLKDKLHELENNLLREKDSYSQIQKDNMLVQSRLETEKQNLSESLNSIEKKLNEEKNKNNELTGQLKNSKTSYNFLKQEFEEYKLKATKTLQAKDRLIATLKDSGSASYPEDGGASVGGINLKAIEIDELKLERDSLKEELNSKNVTLDLVKAEMMDLESQASVEIELLKDQLRNLEDNLEESKRSKDYLEQDIKSLRQQLDYAQEESYKQKTNVNSKLQDKELEIEKLRNQLTTKNLSNSTDKELENRLHLLTENLIQKQTLIEALQSEKHSIFLQLERTEKRLLDYENILASKKNNSTTLRMHDDDDNAVTSKLPYLRESPYDHEVTRKVKRAASEIDKFSIRLGVFLKKYPIARIFVIFYMFLLHLWVIIVLFTYKPEMHDSIYHASVMPHQPN